ncbi:twin-arginine translocase TatA/TatE family subunit [Chitinophaga sp. MM2321]|uniref:Sec-independent protein translocase subunit TatA/TatB n=1 Tax=Chitinophaga sp. MM2321 TaxID=3137178 RepID=UPI0032D5958D
MSELLLIAVVVLLLFGGKKIPELMRGLGKGIREFNDAKNNVRQEIEEGMKERPVQPATTDTAVDTTVPAVETHTSASATDEKHNA